MKELLFFDKMITPKIINFVYWLILAAVIISALSKIFGSYGGFTFQSFIVGLFILTIGAILARIWCELLIVLFKMNEALQDIRNK